MFITNLQLWFLQNFLALSLPCMHSALDLFRFSCLVSLLGSAAKILLYLSAILEGLESTRKWWPWSNRYFSSLMIKFELDLLYYVNLSTWYKIVAGSLEANFVEPAHDKQDFERTIVLSRLEARLVQMQKTYWYVLSSIWLPCLLAGVKKIVIILLFEWIIFFSKFLLFLLLGQPSVIKLAMLQEETRNLLSQRIRVFHLLYSHPRFVLFFLFY